MRSALTAHGRYEVLTANQPAELEKTVARRELAETRHRGWGQVWKTGTF